jgi:Ala-tRNA(Pro) deacylase
MAGLTQTSFLTNWRWPMLHLALSEADAARLRSILEAKLVDLRREIDHTDARRFRDELKAALTTVELLLEQVSQQLESRAVDEDDHPAVPIVIDRYLREHHANYAVIHHPRAFSAMREAAAAHIPGREWAKAVVCLADGRPTLAVLPADHVIDRARLRDLVGADQMRLATEAEIGLLYQGCEPGAVPPLGPLYGQRVFVDTSMTANDEIAFSAGSHRSAIRMRYREFEALVHPTVGRFARAN